MLAWSLKVIGLNLDANGFRFARPLPQAGVAAGATQQPQPPPPCCLAKATALAGCAVGFAAQLCPGVAALSLNEFKIVLNLTQDLLYPHYYSIMFNLSCYLYFDY